MEALTEDITHLDLAPHPSSADHVASTEMPNLVNIPLEIRKKIYGFYLEGLELLVVPNGEYVQEARGKIPQTKIIFPSNALSLLRVNRQLNAELSPNALSRVSLRLLRGGPHCNWSLTLATIPKPFLDQIQYVEVSWREESNLEYEWLQTILAIRDLKTVATPWHPMEPEVCIGFGRLPPHDYCFKEHTAHSLLKFLDDTQLFDTIKGKMIRQVGHVRAKWERYGPVSYARETTIRAFCINKTKDAMWICIISKGPSILSNTNASTS